MKTTTGKDLSTIQGEKKVFNGQKVSVTQHSHQIFYIPKVTKEDKSTLWSVTIINKVIYKPQKLNLQDEIFHTRI